MRFTRKITAPALAAVLLAAPLFAQATLTAEASEPEKLAPLPEHAMTTRNIVDALASRHYIKNALNDQLSSRIYDAYLADLDPARSYLLQSDIDQFETYRYLLDDALKRGDMEPAFKIFNRYLARVLSRFENNIGILEQGVEGFDFTRDETLELDREDAAWASSTTELDDLWRKRLKNSALGLKLSDKEDEKIKELLVKRYTNRLSRTRQTNSEDVFQLFMNAYTGTYDPHTQYFSPRTSENFNINMSLSLEGIGAVLQREDEYTKVVSLVPAGPADKSGMIHPDDKIISVGQDTEGEMVDVIGWRLDEVVQLIRGKKDTVVRLEIIEAENQEATAARIIQITRNTVKLEEQSAKSHVIELEQFGHKHKIGIIDVPTFYIDFQALQRGDADFRSTTADVKKLLEDLIEQEVDGVVVDLRNNGGGSLQEANTLTGLFIDIGPTVQIRGKRNRVNILTDRDTSKVYDGPLAVLVNRLSASASEIFAGAIQDYNRGIIIGGQTFGKGTVQSLLNLNRGQLKLTQAKFYRISGESTQHQGVIPDVKYPASYDIESIGESSLDDPLPWDKIQPTQYRAKSNVSDFLTTVRDRHGYRSEHNPDFAYMRDSLAHRKERVNETRVSLNEQTRIARKDELDAFWVSLENKRRLAKGQTEIASLDELTDEEEAPTLAQAGATGLTPATDTDVQPEGELQGNEMVGVVGDLGGAPDGETAVAPEAQAPAESDQNDGEAGETTGPAHATAEERDAMLVESGNILIDLIEITNRTAQEEARQRSS